MATYRELYALRNDQGLLERVAVACTVAVDVIRSEPTSTPNHANRLIWAKEALGNPLVMAERMVWLLLAANKSLTVSAIQGATDAAVQAAVDATVDVMAQG